MSIHTLKKNLDSVGLYAWTGQNRALHIKKEGRGNSIYGAPAACLRPYGPFAQDFWYDLNNQHLRYLFLFLFTDEETFVKKNLKKVSYLPREPQKVRRTEPVLLLPID